MHFMGKLGLEKVSKRSRRDPDHEKTFLTFTLSVNKIILYQFSMFKSLDSIASVVGMFMYLTISKLKQVLRSRKGLDYNTAIHIGGRRSLAFISIMIIVSISRLSEHGLLSLTTLTLACAHKCQF